jgi:hypothetical protein
MGDFTQASVTQASATQALATQALAILVSLSINTLSINKERKTALWAVFSLVTKEKMNVERIHNLLGKNFLFWRNGNDERHFDRNTWD